MADTTYLAVAPRVWTLLPDVAKFTVQSADEVSRIYLVASASTPTIAPNVAHVVAPLHTSGRLSSGQHWVYSLGQSGVVFTEDDR